MNSMLESRYRKLLSWYPRSWRAANQEAFIGTLLDVAENENRSHPTSQERWAFAKHGIDARLDRLFEPSVRHPASTVALTMGAGLALSEFLVSSWAPWFAGNPAPGSLIQLGPFRDTGFAFAALWVIAVIAALAGRWNVGRVSLLVSVLLGSFSPYLLTDVPGVWSVDRSTLFLLSMCAALAIVGRPIRSQHTAAAVVGWSLLGVLSYTSTAVPGQWMSSRSLWDGNLYAWYATAALEVIAIILAAAQFWRAAFTIALSLLPYVGGLRANKIRGIDVGGGSVALLALPVALALVLLILHSADRLRLPSRTLAQTSR